MTLQQRVSQVIQTSKRASLNAPIAGTAKAANTNNALINSVSNNGVGEGRTIMEKLRDWSRYILGAATLIAMGFAIATFFSLKKHALEDAANGKQILAKAQKLEEHYNEIRKDLDVFVDDPRVRVICDESMQMQSNLDDVWGMKILSVGTGIPVPVDPKAPVKNAAKNVDKSNDSKPSNKNGKDNVGSNPPVAS